MITGKGESKKIYSLTNAFNDALALTINFQIDCPIAIDKGDQWTGIHAHMFAIL